MNLILISLIIHLLYCLIFKPKYNTLSCGIFVWAGKDPKKFNKDKFDKLGIFNVERGKSSCGISYDGEVYIGINSRKLYSDFIVDEKIKPVDFPIVIGHTRQASVGNTVTLDNAHPFAFTTKSDSYEFIGCHNGTIYNKNELAEKYGVEKTVSKVQVFNNSETTVTRTKIDSEILLECIFKSKNFHVLNDYNGGAALAFTNLNEPNILYLFKGASKDYSSSKIETATEERPLYVYVENKNSMYVSSLENSLRTIGGNDKNIIDIDCNFVYKITDGDFLNAEKFPISRLNAQQKEIHVFKNNLNDYYDNMYDEHGYYGGKLKEEVMETLPQKTGTTMMNTLLKAEKEKGKEEINNIYNEQLLLKENENLSNIYFNKLRFWRNGHLITGIYCWINDYGYYYLGRNKKEAEAGFWYNTDKHFDKGYFYDSASALNPNIPFKTESIIEPALFYFVEGVQLRTYFDYASTLTLFKELKRNEYLEWVKLSNISTHPIINISFQHKIKEQQAITLDGKIYSGKFTVLGAEKKYNVISGNLTGFEVTDYYLRMKNKENTFSNLKLVKDELKEELKVENPVLSTNEEITTQNSDDELLENLIEKEAQEVEVILEIVNEDFTEPIKDFQQAREKMLKYSHNSLGAKVISFIDNTLKEINKLINV